MSFALKELARLLAPDGPVIGVVVSIEAGRVRLATARGAVLAQALEPLAIGDRVLLRNGLAQRAPLARHSYPV